MPGSEPLALAISNGFPTRRGLQTQHGCTANPHQETLTTAAMRMFSHDVGLGELNGMVPTLHIDNEREYCTGANPNFPATARIPVRPEPA